MRMRNMLYPVGGDLREYVDYYGELAGAPVDREPLCYYTVMACLLSPLGVASTIQNPDASISTMLPRFGWDVTLRRGLCDALFEAYGIAVEAPPIPPVSLPPRTDLQGFLVSHIEHQRVPIARDDWERFLVRGAVGVAQTVALLARLGEMLEKEDLGDMARVLGSPVDDRETGLAGLSKLVAEDPAGRATDLLWLFSRMERRREFLWAPMLIAQKSQPFERLFPPQRIVEGPALG
jgi:hypothetical protein